MVARLPVNTRGQDTLHGGRQLELRKRTRDLHPSIAHQRSFVEQCLQDFLDKERVALGAPDNHALERGEISTLSRPWLFAAPVPFVASAPQGRLCRFG